MRSLTQVAVGVCLGLAGLAHADYMLAVGQVVPEFGASVSFHRSSPRPRLAMLRGKAVIVVAIPAKTAAAAKSSRQIIRQMEQAYRERPEVALVALLSGVESAAAAAEMMAALQGDPEVWCVGVDREGVWTHSVTGGHLSRRYIVIDAQGGYVSSNDLGLYYGEGPKTGRYVVATLDIAKDCGSCEPALAAAEAPAEFAGIVRRVEAGDLAGALGLCTAKEGTADDRDALKALRKAIRQRAEALLTQTARDVADESRAWGDRYELWKRLDGLCRDLQGLPAAAQAASVAAAVAAAPEMEREKQAERACARALKLRREATGPRDEAAATKELRAVATRHQGTRYGACAAAAVRR